MERAQREKAPIQAYADRVACYFAPMVLVLACLTLIAWMVLYQDQSFEKRIFYAFTSGISVIVVACPCALGLATPTAVMVGTGIGATHGLLIKGGAVLENMHSVDTIVFDKTGTLTTGKVVLGVDKSLELLQNISSDDPLLQNLPTKIPKDQLALWLAACSEAQSEHPLAKAIVNAAKGRWGNDITCSSEGVSVDSFRIVVGMGVECTVAKRGWGIYSVRVGSAEWAKASSHEFTIDDEKASFSDSTGDKEAIDIRKRGQIAIYISVLNVSSTQQVARRVIGVFGIVDPVQRESRSTVAALRKLGIDVWLCTGDHELTALAVAHECGIDEENVCAGVTPEEKANLVTRLQKRNRGRTARGFVAFVGDGINDAVALARADVGIAIGAGTEVAVEAADVVLVRSSLHDVVVAFHLSKVVFRRIMMNFFWALGYNVFALPFAAGILYPIMSKPLQPEWAGLMMAFSSVSVVTSSLLLRRYRRPSIDVDGSLKGASGCLMFLESTFTHFSSRCYQSCSQYENIPLASTSETRLRSDLELV
jgi:Cu+-exporting ATPase